MRAIHWLAAVAVMAITLPATAAEGDAATAKKGPATQQDLQTAARETTEKAHAAEAYVLRLVEQAQESGDVIKLNCVNDKLAALRKQVGRADEAAATVAEGGEAARKAYVQVTHAGDRALQLRAEAKQCVGELAVAIDEDMVVDVDGPEDLAGEQVVLPALPPVTVRPPAASPSE